MMDRIVLLTNPGIEGRALSHRLIGAGLNVVMIVSEEVTGLPDYSWPSRFARRALGDRSVDRLASAQLSGRARNTLGWEREKSREATEFLQRSLDQAGIPEEWPKDIEHFRTGSVNDAVTVQRVRQARPDLLVVFGTGLLRRPILQLPAKGALNAHSSLLPHYKGPRSEFWQCYHNDPRYVGITVHLVNEGVDSGAVLFQVATGADLPMDPYRMRALNTLAVIDNYAQVVADHLQGKIDPRPQGPTETRTYRFKDVTMDLRIALKERLEQRDRHD